MKKIVDNKKNQEISLKNLEDFNLIGYIPKSKQGGYRDFCIMKRMGNRYCFVSVSGNSFEPRFESSTGEGTIRKAIDAGREVLQFRDVLELFMFIGQINE